MKTKTLAQVAGIIGTIAGTLLAILPVIILMIVPIFENEDFTGVILAIIFIVFTLVKIATLILGILSLIYYKDDKRISMAPSILLIVFCSRLDSIFRLDWWHRHCHRWCPFFNKLETISSSRIAVYWEKGRLPLLFLIDFD